MPIIDNQRRLTEVGRIRMGEKNQRGLPVKLDNFRLTSPNRGILEEVATKYGGDVTEWDEEWQVKITEPELDILLPQAPGIFSEWYEVWSAGGLQKRCTGEREEVEDKPCSCIPGQRECKPTSRLSVWLPEIATFGVWMLSSTGYNANAELGGTVVALQQAAEALGRPVKATLRLDQRKKVVAGQTRRFSVPVIEPREPVKMVLEAPKRLALPDTLSEQPEPPQLAPPPPDKADWPESGTPCPFDCGRYFSIDEPNEAIDEHVRTEHPAEPPEPVDTSHEIIAENLRKQIVISCREVGITDDERHEMVEHVTEGRTSSSKELQEGELPALWERMTTTLSAKCVPLMHKLWSTNEVAYLELHAQPGLERDVKEWHWKQWQQVYEYCGSLLEQKKAEAGR